MADIFFDDEKPPERRVRRRDRALTFVSVVSVAAWVTTIASAILVKSAQPRNTFTRTFLNRPALNAWDSGLLFIAFIIMALSFSACAAAFFVGLSRRKRKTDRASISVLAAGAVTFVGCVMFLINFNLMF